MRILSTLLALQWWVSSGLSPASSFSWRDALEKWDTVLASRELSNCMCENQSQKDWFCFRVVARI